MPAFGLLPSSLAPPAPSPLPPPSSSISSPFDRDLHDRLHAPPNYSLLDLDSYPAAPALTASGFHGFHPWSWGSGGRLSEFLPPSDYPHFDVRFSTEHLPATSAEPMSSSYFHSDILPYRSEAPSVQQEACSSSPRKPSAFPCQRPSWTSPTLFHGQGASVAQSGNSTRSPTNWQHNGSFDVGWVSIVPPFTDDSSISVDRHEKSKRSIFDELRSSKDDEWANIRQSSEASSSLGFSFPVSPPQIVLKPGENGQRQAHEDKKESIFNLPQGWQDTCGTKHLFGGRDSVDLPSVLPYKVGSREIPDSIPSATDHAPSESVTSSHHPFTNGFFAGAKSTSCVDGCEGGSSSVPLSAAALDSKQKTSCKSFLDNLSTPIKAETKESSHRDNARNAECDLESSHTEKGHLNNDIPSQVLPSSNGCQLLISSICNLSRVLLTSQSGKYPNVSEDLDVNAIENSIFMLSRCLLERLSDSLAKATREPIMRTQDSFQSQGQKAGQASEEADVCTGFNEQARMTIDLMFMPPSMTTLDRTTVLPAEITPLRPPNGKDLRGTDLERNTNVASTKDYVGEAAISCIKSCIEKSLEEVSGLQHKLLKDIAYERSESNAAVAGYKKLWTEAQEALHNSRLETLKTRLELEGFSQAMRKLEHQGDSGVSHCKPSEIAKCNSEEQPLSKSQREGNLHVYERLGKCFLKEEMLTGCFGPVKRVEVDLDSFPDTKEVITRYSLLQARGTSNNKNMNDEVESVCDNLLKSHVVSLVRKDEGVTHHPSLLLGRQASGSSSGCSCNSHTSELPLDLDKPLEYGKNLSSDEPTAFDVAVNSDAQFQVSLRSEACALQSETCAGNAEKGGFVDVDSLCSVGSNFVSEKMEDDTSSHGFQDGQAVLDAGGTMVSQVESSHASHQASNDVSEQLQVGTEILQERQSDVTWDTHRQGEAEIICLRPSESEDRKACLEGDAEWEHVLVSRV